MSSVRMQLSRAIKRSRVKPKEFWKRGRIHLASSCLKDLRSLLCALARPQWDAIWTRPIALLIPRTPTHTMYSDASYGGIGGWSPDFDFMWRVMHQDLQRFGFHPNLMLLDDPAMQGTTGSPTRAILPSRQASPHRLKSIQGRARAPQAVVDAAVGGAMRTAFRIADL